MRVSLLQSILVLLVQARSVVVGLHIKMLRDVALWKKWASQSAPAK